ncbi:MAG: hypothetical protein C4538_10960 [Nitrospiraceae bacterium]|nr:MAG: hypothetical protein C4538_10960 [Nitrospiraceae bacterium]
MEFTSFSLIAQQSKKIFLYSKIFPEKSIPDRQFTYTHNGQVTKKAVSDRLSFIELNAEG